MKYDNIVPETPAPTVIVDSALFNLTMRDYFAGQVLCSVLSATSSRAPGPTTIAEIAYKIADAMLKAREA